MHILESGAGVVKTQFTKVIYESIRRFYRKQPGENPHKLRNTIVAPTGLAAYHVKGNTINRALHGPIKESNWIIRT